MRYLCVFSKSCQTARTALFALLALMVPMLSAQDGAAIYKERCASCHDAPEGRVPSITAIKAMSGAAVYLVLTNGSMRTRAEGLSSAELFALIGYIAPTGGTQTAPAKFERTCKGDATFKPAANAPQWNGWSASMTRPAP